MAECTDAQRRYLDAVLSGNIKAASSGRLEILREALEPGVVEQAKAAYFAELQAVRTAGRLLAKIGASLGENEADLLRHTWYEEWSAANG